MFGVTKTLAIAGAMLAAIPASASTYITFNGLTGVFGNDQVAPGGSFNDTIAIPGLTAGKYLINLTISSTYSAGLKALQNIDFTSVTINNTPFNIGTTGRNEYRFINDIPSKLDNLIKVSGTSGDNASYSGTIDVERISVPEPASWAMMVGGFGLIGFALRRQRKPGAALV